MIGATLAKPGLHWPGGETSGDSAEDTAREGIVTVESNTFGSRTREPGALHCKRNSKETAQIRSECLGMLIVLSTAGR